MNEIKAVFRRIYVLDASTELLSIAGLPGIILSDIRGIGTRKSSVEIELDSEGLVELIHIIIYGL
jgi:hypothetical protein